MVKLETAFGEITLSEDVLETIVGHAVNECFGVAGMAARDSVDGFVSLFKRNRVDKGVRILPAGEDMISIELHIVVIYGLNIAAVSTSIMEKVRYTVEELTGLTVHEVAVCIDDMKA